MKSHFQFSKKQRNGIFLLLLLILALQLVYMFVDFSKPQTPQIPDETLEAYRAEVKVLKDAQAKNAQPKLYPFNPNFITDYKGYTLGMSTTEIDRLHAFRAKDKWVNSAKEFQNVTKISDSLLAVISPYFKFPDWVVNPKPKQQKHYTKDFNSPKTFAQKQDLNKASAQDLQAVYGVGEKLSQRIITYRNRFNGGFVADVELGEVWGLSPEVIQNITNQFTVKTPRSITSFNLNKASRDELVTIPHIDYEIANHIIEERTLREGFKTIDDLTKVEQFPVKKLAIIRLYLHL